MTLPYYTEVPLRFPAGSAPDLPLPKYLLIATSLLLLFTFYNLSHNPSVQSLSLHNTSLINMSSSLEQLKASGTVVVCDSGMLLFHRSSMMHAVEHSPLTRFAF